jgi:ABC-2 type transport system ATP-binding protein
MSSAARPLARATTSQRSGADRPNSDSGAVSRTGSGFHAGEPPTAVCRSRPRTSRPQTIHPHGSVVGTEGSASESAASAASAAPIPRVLFHASLRDLTVAGWAPTNVEAVFRDDPPALELRGLTKRYDDGTLAVENFDLEVHDGAFFGLLGPNGAGKTTAISAICNLIRVTEGEVLVFGEPANSLLARRWIGLAEQDINLDRFLSVRETLVYHGGYFGMGKDEAEERAEQMIDAFDLRAKRDVRAPKLSGGQRRRLLLARALMHKPRLVILDEPTAGVDFELRLELWRYIRQLHAEGTTILLTTHYLEEAEELCEEIALIRGGRLLARDSADGLRERYEANTLADVYVKAMEMAR